MTNSLLGSDQFVNAQLFLPASPPKARSPKDSLFLEQTHESAMLLKNPGLPIGMPIGDSLRNSGVTVESHLSQARQALLCLSGYQQRARRIWQHRMELTWLAKNRHRFAGQWIALEGDRLLASGPTAVEVFAQVENRPEPPLVIRIEEEDLPFAGW